MYKLLKPILFKLEPERAHRLTLQALQYCYQLGLLRSARINNPRTIMGLTFANPIGLAAGLDKNGDYIDALASLGFGFLEIGTVTPRPQAGNATPRLFRLVDDEAIINRLGFNNKGMDYVAKRLVQTSYRGILGINIGKNRDTPIDNAFDDYVSCFRTLAPFASYIAVNISSPNTEGLRDLQQYDALTILVKRLKAEQTLYADKHKYVPLVLKISPDLSQADLKAIASVCLEQGVDGVIATNTTINSRRDHLQDKRLALEAGGLSGKPLFAQSTHIVEMLHEMLQDKIAIIGVGGISNVQSAEVKYAAGASLLQIYSGLIYHGPGLIQELAKIALAPQHKFGC